MPVVLAIFVAQFEAFGLRVLFQMSPEEALVDVTELADFKRTVIDGFPGLNLLLLRGGPGWRLRKNELLENAGQRGVTHAPLFQQGMKLRVEQAAVVTRDIRGFVLRGVITVDQMEQFQQLIVEVGEGVISKLGIIAQVGDEAAE